MIKRFEPRTTITETTTTERDQIMPGAMSKELYLKNQNGANFFEALSVHAQTAVSKLNDD